MTKKLHPRFLRFGLQTMFVLVAVLCGWLAWETSVVRERQAALKELGRSGAFQFTTAEAWKERYPPGAPVPAAATIPLMRRWLGDEAIQEIWYGPGLQSSPQEELRRLARIFPEAELREAHFPPCHPGCFPRGTIVDTPSGPRGIESVAPGDLVFAIAVTGEVAACEVQSVFVTDNRLWKIETGGDVLFTTQTQPLCLADGSIRPAGELQPGEQVLRRRNGAIRAEKVLRVSPTPRTEKVFNLILGDSEIFIANGYLARSKPPAPIAVSP